MAIIRWIGNQTPLVGVFTAFIGTNDVSTGYIITIGSKFVEVAGQAGGASTTATALAAALAASTAAEFLELTWTSSGANVIGTVNTAGNLPIITATKSGGTGTISGGLSGASPNNVNDGANWDSGTIPTTGDTAYVDNSSVSLLYNLSSLSGTLAEFIVGPNFTGQIGLPQTNANGYQEYRPTALALAATNAWITATGSGLVRLNFGTTAATVIVYGTGSSSESGVATVVIDANSSSSTLEVLGGNVGAGTVTKAANLWGTISVGTTSQQSHGIATFAGAQTGATGTTVEIGPNVQINSTTNVTGGTVLLDTTGGKTIGSTINQYGGTLSVIGSAAITNLNVYGGTCYWSSTGTITNATAGSGVGSATPGATSAGGTLDFSQDLRTKTVSTAVQMSAGSTVNDPFGAVSSLAVKTVNCTLAQVTVALGFNHTFTRS